MLLSTLCKQFSISRSLKFQSITTRMKTFVVLAFLAFGCQASYPDITVTEDLLAAQADLTIGHEFSEEYLVQNREILSNYLSGMELEILDAFMTAYEEIKLVSIDTRAQMDEFVEPSVCKDNVRARWELQVTRFGQRLSKCLADSDRYLKGFTDDLNNLHDESRRYTVVIPNGSVNVLSRVYYIDLFTSLIDRNIKK